MYEDRSEAGKKLGWKLKELDLENVVVLAVPSGGIPVAKEVTEILNSPLDLIISRKIQFPWTTEAGFGAVTADSIVYLESHSERLPKEIIEAQTQKAKREVEHREKEFIKGRKRIDLSGKTVILVDDGLAAGSTMLAAVKSVKKKKPGKVIVAVPTSSASAVKLIKPQVDELVSLYIHPENRPFAVASSYQNWYDLTDQEVKDYLN
jgi:predicted phosphoribosyltransferase